MSAAFAPTLAAQDAASLLFARRMAAVVQVQRQLASSDATPDELMDSVPELALSVVEATGAVFELIDGDVAVLRAGTAAVVERNAIGFRLALKGSLTGEAVRLNSTVRCDETEGDSRVDEQACRRFGLRSVLIAVIRGHSGPIGTIKLVHTAPGHFGAAEADSLELVAEALGAAIQRKGAEAESRQLMRNQLAMIELQQEVASSSAGLDSALELIAARAQQMTGCDGAAIAVQDREDLVFRAGSGIAAPFLLRRLRAGSLASLAIASGTIVRCDDSETDEHIDRALCREVGVRSAISAPLRTADGPAGGTLNLFSARSHAFTSMDSGTLQLLAEWLGVVLQRSAAAKELRDSESQYRSLFASHPMPMWVYDIETLKFLAVNDSAVAEYGYSRDEFLSMTLPDLRPPGGVALLHDYLAHRGDGPVSTTASTHRRKDGSAMDIEASDSNTQFEGRAARLVFVQNVTERKRVERQIQKSEALLSIAGSVARVGGWSLDLSDDSFSWTDELCMIYEVPAGTPSSVGRALSFYVPQSRKAILAAGARLRAEGTPYDLELELVTARGRRLWVRSIAQPVLDEHGQIIGLRGAVQDVSERRQAEDKVRALAVSLKTTLESITDAFYTLDREWRFTYINVETERLMQRSRDDLIGRCLWDFFPESEVGDIGKHVRDAVERNVTVVFETYYKHWGQWLEFHAYPSPAGLTVYFRDVTERRQSQEKLLLLETCVAWMRDSVVITEVDPATGSNTRIVFVNEAFTHRTGFSREESLGNSPKMLQGPKTQRSELDKIAAALAAREAVRVEVINYTKSGVGYWVELEIVPIWSPKGEVTHFVAVMRDTTERRLAQESLRSLNETLEAKVAERTAELELSNNALASKELEISSVVEHMADGVVTFDDHGIVRTANPKVEEIFGVAPTALVGGSVSVLLPALQGLLAGTGDKVGGDAASTIAMFGGETFGRHRSGEPIALDVAISDFRIGGQRLWTAIVRDIGERLRNVADLELAKRIAEEASNAKSAFVATMSHEIRTPMNGVIGMIDVLHQTPLAPDQSRMLGVARDSAHALLAIIEDILDFSKIEAGRIELERLPMSLGGVVEKAAALMTGMALGKNVEVEVSIDPGLPAAVWGDAGRLRQIVVNLASNAIKFSAGRTGAKVVVRAGLGDAGCDRGMLQFEVEDNGIGMDAATVERLFRPFTQADASTTRRFGGTGLGLAISHHLVQLMGGTLHVRSTPGVGSVFSVSLPLAVAPVAALAHAPAQDSSFAGSQTGVPSATATVAATAVSHPGSRILVAEDNNINQQVITAQLARLGYRAVVVANGREALALWRGGGFDALLTDLQMPEMDGYELAATIRAEEGERRRKPILALTANAVKEEAGRCKATGMDDYLTKPVAMDTLDGMLKRWLGPAPTDLPPVDSQVLPSLIGDDTESIGEFMLDFIASATDGAHEMAEAIAASDGERRRGVAHRLKSSARAVGALQLGDLCEAIENAPLGGEIASSAATLAAFEAELARVDRWVAAQGWSRQALQGALA